MSMAFTPRNFTSFANMQAASRALQVMAAEERQEMRRELDETKELRQRDRREARQTKHAARFC